MAQGTKRMITPYEVCELMRMMEVDGWGINKCGAALGWSPYFTSQIRDMIWDGLEARHVANIKRYCERHNLR